MNLKIAGIAGAATIDTAGEVLEIEGCDISHLVGGPINTEHTGPTDIEKEEKSDFKGFSTIVGRIHTAKKIYGFDDCENDLQKEAWADLKLPFIWVTGEIFSENQDHPNAQAAAAIIREHLRDPDLSNHIGFSVEGNVLKRDGNVLKETVVRALALTMKPANRSAIIKTILVDKPQSSTKVVKNEQDGSNLLKTSYMGKMYIINTDKYGLANALNTLKKTISAGYASSAPSSLSGGPALQKEQEPKTKGFQIDTLLKLIGKQKINRETLKRALPNIPDLELEKIEKILKARKLKKLETEMEVIYKSLFK